MIESLIIKTISELFPAQVAAGISPHQRVRNPWSLFELVTSDLIMPVRIRDGITVHEIARRLHVGGFHCEMPYLHAVLNRAVREEVLRVVPGPANGKRGRNPRLYALN